MPQVYIPVGSNVSSFRKRNIVLWPLTLVNSSFSLLRNLTFVCPGYFHSLNGTTWSTASSDICVTDQCSSPIISYFCQGHQTVV